LDYDKTGRITADDTAHLTEELLEFYHRLRWRVLPDGLCASVFPAGTVAHRCGIVVEVDRPIYSTFLGFARAEEMTPYEGIMEKIEEKRKLDYSRENALWLIVNVSDTRGPFEKALDAVKLASPAIVPFERVIVHDGFEHFLSLPNAD
jgi:hypothetical protein